MPERTSGFVRVCSVFLPREGTKAIVVGMYNHGGLYAEREGQAILVESTNLQTLGESTLRKLDRCVYEESFNYRCKKASDWPAFKTSGMKAIRSFEAADVRYLVSGANSANVTWEVASPTLPNGVELRAFIPAASSADRIGSWIAKFHDFFLGVEVFQRNPRSS